MELSKGGRSLLQGRGEELNTLETEGQMLQRVMPELMGMKNILVLNDEAHHCYREKPRRRMTKRSEGRRQARSREEQRGRPPVDLRPGDRSSASSGITQRHRPVRDAVLPARLRLCRRHAVPLDDERLLADGRHRMRHREAAARAGGRQHSRRRDAQVPQPLGAHRHEDAEEGPRQGQGPRPAQPARRTADRARSALRPLREDLRAVERSGASTSRPASSSSATTPPPRSWSTTTSPASTARTRTAPRRWKTAGWRCSAISTSTATRSRGRDTLLIDSEQLESGEALDDNFRDMAADEIERFRREIIERTGDRAAGREHHRPGPAARGDEHGRQDGRLGESIRCVVSVSMLTEGWDANTVTHVLGVRAFGTQLLCEQVIGRALRRQSYDLNEDRPVQRRVRRRARHSVRLHRQAGRRAAAAAARDRPGEGRCGPSATPGNPLPARRGLPGGAAGGAADGRVQRRFRAGADARPGRAVDHEERRASSAKAWI